MITAVNGLSMFSTFWTKHKLLLASSHCHGSLLRVQLQSTFFVSPVTVTITKENSTSVTMSVAMCGELHGTSFCVSMILKSVSVLLTITPVFEHTRLKALYNLLMTGTHQKMKEKKRDRRNGKHRSEKNNQISQYLHQQCLVLIGQAVGHQFALGVGILLGFGRFANRGQHRKAIGTDASQLVAYPWGGPHLSIHFAIHGRSPFSMSVGIAVRGHFCSVNPAT